jgi:Major Facilitator Superfamily
VAGLRAALKIEGFRALLISYLINRAGDVVGSLALAVVILALTGSAMATAALFLATQFVPGLIGPVIVTRVDHHAPGRLLPALYLVEGVLFVALAAMLGRLAAAPIIAVALIDATLAFVARTVTRSASASTLVASDLVPEGKAAFNVALAMAMIGGPVIAGFAVALLGASTALAIDGGSFLIAGGLVACAPGLRAAPVERPPARQGRLRDGLRYIARHPAIRGLILGEGIAFVFFYLVVPVTVVYAVRSLHAGTGAYAAILASWGVGIAIGSAIQVRLARRVGSTMILLCTGAVALGYLGSAVAPTIAVACAASVVGGIGNGTQWASVETAIHQLVAESFRTRTAATLEALAAIAPGVGILLGGLLTAAFSPRAAYLVAGVGLLVLIGAARLSRLTIAPPARSAPQPPPTQTPPTPPAPSRQSQGHPSFQS